MPRSERLLDLLTIREAAALAGVPVETVRRWQAEGQLAGRRFGPRGMRRYARQDVLRLAQRQEARVREAQQLVVDVARAISGSLDLDAVARTIVDSAVRVVGADRCAIYLVNADRTRVDPLWGIDVHDPEATERLFFAQPIPVAALPMIAHALEHPEPLVVLDTFTHPLSNPELFRFFGTRTLISCGLCGADGKVFAVMPFCWQDEPYAVRDDDVFLARSLAALAEVALANAQLFAAIEQERARATTINDIVTAVSAGRSLSDTLARAIDGLVAQLGADEGSIWLSTEDSDVLIGAAETRVLGRSRINAVLNLATSATSTRAIEQQEPLLVRLADTEGEEREWFLALGIQDSLYVPLLADGRLVGIAFANYDAGAPELLPADFHFAGALASQCALAIERVQLLEAESARAAELEAVITQMDEGVILADQDGQIVLVNDYAARLYGPAEVDALMAGERSAFSMFHLDGTPFAEDELPLRRAALEGRASHVEYRLPRPDGLDVFASGSATPIRDSAGTLRGAVLLVRDVTTWRRLEADKDLFLGVVGHELKTPLTTIKGHTELASRRIARGSDPAVILAGLDAVATQVRRMEGLLTDLLDIQRLESGALPLHRALHDLVQIAEDAAERAQALTEKHVVELAVLSAGPLRVSVDRDRLDQICDNILSNAIKYSPNGGTITLEISVVDAEAVLRFRDPGIGIPEQGRERLFERFYRGSNVPASEYGGLGIGLALSRELALRHGGRLELETTGPVGTTFRLTLPLAEPHDTAERGGRAP